MGNKNTSSTTNEGLKEIDKQTNKQILLCMDGDALYAGGCIQLLHLCAFIAEKIITLGNYIHLYTTNMTNLFYI